MCVQLVFIDLVDCVEWFCFWQGLCGFVYVSDLFDGFFQIGLGVCDYVCIQVDVGEYYECVFGFCVVFVCDVCLVDVDWMLEFFEGGVDYFVWIVEWQFEVVGQEIVGVVWQDCEWYFCVGDCF